MKWKECESGNGLFWVLLQHFPGQVEKPQMACLESQCLVQEANLKASEYVRAFKTRLTVLNEIYYRNYHT
jgi:hypothetical protein